MKRPEGLPVGIHIWTSHWHPEQGHRKGFCRHAVHDVGGVGHHQCCRKAKIQEYGLGWCKQHAPSAQEAKKRAWDVKFNKNWAADKRRWAIHSAHTAIANAAIGYFSQKSTFEALEKAVITHEKLVEENAAALRDG